MGIITRESGFGMRRKATPYEQFRAQALCRGRGHKDPMIKKLPPKRRAFLRFAIRDAAMNNKCHPSELVWRMDRHGVVHIQHNTVGRIA